MKPSSKPSCSYRTHYIIYFGTAPRTMMRTHRLCDKRIRRNMVLSHSAGMRNMHRLFITHRNSVKPVVQSFGKSLAEDDSSNKRASLNQTPGSFVVSSGDITCVVSAYAQLKSTSRFTTSIRLASPPHDSITALVDTCAEGTCISTRLFNKMRTSIFLSIFLAEMGLRLLSNGLHAFPSSSLLVFQSLEALLFVTTSLMTSSWVCTFSLAFVF